MKEKIKNQKTTKASPNLNSKIQPLNSNAAGITLIALIITIIIMLILLAATISVTLNSGLFAKAAKASKDWNEADQNIQGEVDNIGNYIDSIVEEATGGLENNVPLISSVTLNTKTINSFTVNVTATDEDGADLTYSLYTNGSIEPADTTTAVQGQEVQLTASNLGMYTDYTYYIEVTDNISNSKSTENTVKTKCSGQTTTCATNECTTGSTVACTMCSGSGKCATCSGNGTIRCYHSNRKVVSSFQHGGSQYCGNCSGYTCTYSDNLRCSDCGATRTLPVCDNCGGYGSGGDWSNDTKNCSNCLNASGICSSCSGNKNIYTYCSHELATSHRFCDHYENTTETEHLICDHSSSGAEHE